MAPASRPAAGHGLASLPSSRSFFPSALDLGQPTPVGNAVGQSITGSQLAVDYYGGNISPRGSFVPPMAPPLMASPQTAMSGMVDPRFEDPFSVHIMPGAPEVAPVSLGPGSACAPPPGHICAGDGRVDVERLRQLGCGECADCGKRNPDWASITFGTVICTECAAVHNAMVKKRRATDASMFSHLWGEQAGNVSEVRPLLADAWTSEEAFHFWSKGGNGKVNAALAKRARMLAPIPPPDTPRADIDSHIARKYGGQLPKGRIPPIQPQGFFEGAPSAVAPGGQRSAGTHAAGPPMPSRVEVCAEPGLVVVEVFSFDLAGERAEDLRGLLNPMPLSLTACLCVGRAVADPTKASKAAKAVFDPPARRELPWDLQEAWLWCRLEDDNIITGSRLAAVCCVDMLSVVAMAPNSTQSSADVVAELYARDEDEEHHVVNRVAELQGPHGTPGPHGPLGRHSTKEREDWNFLCYGLRCGTIHMRVTLVNTRGH